MDKDWTLLIKEYIMALSFMGGSSLYYRREKVC